MRIVLILAVVAATGTAAYYWSVSQQAETSASAGAPMVEVTLPQLQGLSLAGQSAYGEFCAVCHGENAAGQLGVAPPLIHKIYEPSHHGDMAFVFAAKRGVQSHHWPFGDMPPVVDITDEELGQIISFVRAVQQENGIN